MKRQQFAFAVILTYLWVMMILLGSIILETFMVYPNIFYDALRCGELSLGQIGTNAYGSIGQITHLRTP
jgi:hypothetical protein